MFHWRSLSALLLLILGANVLLYQVFSAYRYRWIVIHHSASPRDNYQCIKDYHQRIHHWRDARYHLILSNGSTDVPEGHLEATGRYRHLSYALATKSKRFNVLGLHLCIVGNYERNAFPEALKSVLGHAVQQLQKTYHIPNDHLLLHRDIGATLCPGKHLTKDKIRSWLEDAAPSCPAPLKMQHNTVIDQAGFSLHTLPLPFILAACVLTPILLLIWALGFFFLGRNLKSESQSQPTSGIL